MTHCDFSGRSARDEMRHIIESHIIESSEPGVIIGSDNDQDREGAERRTRVKWDSCASCMQRKLRAVATSCMIWRQKETRACSAWRRSLQCQERERQWRICALTDWPHAMKEDQDLSTQVYGRSPTRDKLACGCKENARARIDTLVLTRATQSRIGNNVEPAYVKLPEQCRNN